MTRQGIVKRAAQPRATAAPIVTITAPSDDLCGLPANQRVCVCAECPASLVGSMPPGVDHPTGCALDVGGLVATTTADANRPRPVEWRRHDCDRLFACEEGWIDAAHSRAHTGAKCPTGCLGYMPLDGGLVPMSALARARKGPR